MIMFRKPTMPIVWQRQKASKARWTKDANRHSRKHRMRYKKEMAKTHQFNITFVYSNQAISCIMFPWGTDTLPSLFTRNLQLKFHLGSPIPVESLINFQTSGAPPPFTLPNAIRTPTPSVGKPRLCAKSRILASVSNSSNAYSRDGNARITRFSGP